MQINTLTQAKKMIEKLKKSERDFKALQVFFIAQINSSGLKQNYLATQLNISQSTFTTRIKEQDFTLVELEKLLTILK